jgi:hypothetical protein
MKLPRQVSGNPPLTMTQRAAAESQRDPGFVHFFSVSALKQYLRSHNMRPLFLRPGENGEALVLAQLLRNNLDCQPCGHRA